MRSGVMMLPDIQPRDVVTPSQAARIFGIPASTMRSWIRRKKIKTLGQIGRYNTYDYRELADLEASMRCKDPGPAPG